MLHKDSLSMHAMGMDKQKLMMLPIYSMFYWPILSAILHREKQQILNSAEYDCVVLVMNMLSK